ncbi:KH domain-containing protein [Schleiferilactobacillus harbinensis]|jgi:spoIIIJ-associated protein|uniref:RNA-binding protein KhpB n=1 Tax=Schleiferilactobacillus harbinensis DSM 16991 TaxID=1122147 RepID=A0A0R1X814_9LACO|nr:RNA-binding cell elongation regulator Jag/EloR [Schleiferilactobacillus harbinensis]KRM26318.1 RNA-binding protein [Schleiferilactobacillus harbinensis DSM 16991]MBO3092575.1 protein jag [Schleiferilactobacillus harbinensis]QFR63530.1 KH domain-containing protein [Schleiferilactobacillus harbinensis]
MPTYEGRNLQEAIDNGLAELGLARDEVTVDVIAEGKRGFLGFGRKPAVVNINKIEINVDSFNIAVPAPPKHHHHDLPHPHLPGHNPEKVTATAGTATMALVDDPPDPSARPAAGMTNAREQHIEAALAQVSAYVVNVTTALALPTTVKIEKTGRDKWTFFLATDREGLLIGKHGRTINSLQYLAQILFSHLTHSHDTVELNVGNYRERREQILEKLAVKTARDVIASGQPIFLDPMPSFERKVLHATLADNSYVITHSEGDEPKRYVVIERKKGSVI